MLLHGLRSVEPSHKVTIRDLDMGLGQLLSTRCADQALEFLCYLLPRSKGALELSEFENVQPKTADGGPRHISQRRRLLDVIGGGGALRWAKRASALR